MAGTKGKTLAFACEQCKSGKRKCDGIKPKCSLCSRLGKPCTYVEQRPKKRKYWDEDYVKGLEQQVQALLAVVRQYERQFGILPSSETAPLPLIKGLVPDEHQEFESNLVNYRQHEHSDGLKGPISLAETLQNHEELPQFPTHERSPVALEELSVMMWRMNLGDGAVITQDGDSALSYEIAADCAVESSHISPPEEILRYSQDLSLLSKLASAFLDNINQEHQFTPYTSTSFLDQYPYQRIDETFLHTAIFATGAAFLASRDPNMAKVGEDFAKYAEKLVFDCCRYRPTLSVIQGMCILSFRSLSIGKDHLGWMFISMAGGLCVHLRLHVLALDECAGRALKPTSPEIRTFWMFYFVDVSAITILGRNCALPWRRVNVPEFHTTLNAETADLAELSFAWQSQLWYTHAEAMDQIFAPSFEKLAMAQQIRLLVSTLEQLNTFFRSKPHRLHMNNDAAKPTVFFHLQYHMAIMIIISSFLRSFTSSDTPGISEAESNSSLLVLRSITSAASETIRLCRLYRDKYTFTMAHPIIVHHLLSAILVHLMNATSSNITLRRQSSRWLRTGMGLMDELRETWPTRVNKCIRVVRVLAQKWGAVGALPMAFAAPVEPSAKEEESPRQDASFSSRLDNPTQTSIGVYDDHDATPFNGHAWQTGDISSVSEFLGAFGSLSSLPDLGWLYEGQDFDTSRS